MSRFRHSVWARVGLVALLVAGCASPIGRAGSSVAPGAAASPSTGPSASSLPSGSPSGSPSSADAAVYAQIEAQVQAMRELKATTTVKPVLLDSAGVASYLTKINEAETNHTALADESRLFIDMGLLPARSSLEQMELALDSGQVIGFYDPKSKGLYVLSNSGGVGGLEKLTFSHEYTHALQDQNFGLDKLATDTPDQGDRDLARTALPEGDATLLMTQWSTKYLSLSELMAIANDSLSGPQQQQLNDAPPILRETLEFPYNQGLAFVQGAYSSGGWAAVDKIYSDPPASTSQILHPELYTQRVEPVVLTVPAVPASLSGWKQTMQDTLGEFQLGVWLAGAGERNSGWADAVNAWAGDRVGLYEGLSAAWAVVLKTQWRTADGTAAFEAAASTLLGQMGGASRTCVSGDNVLIALASEQSLLPLFATCAG